MKYLIDTNLLLLLVVGLTDPKRIEKHGRTSDRFTQKHFMLLREIVSKAEVLVTTPNILTETSNLLGLKDDALSKKYALKFAELINEMEEIYVDSKTACKHVIFSRLGLTDAAIATLKSEKYIVLTSDGPLRAVCDLKGIGAEKLAPLFYE